MFRTKIKKLLAVLCIMVLIMPYTSEVLAASLTHETEKALIETSRLHEGGEESSGTLSSDYADEYDTNPYTYRIKDTIIFKLMQSGDTNFQDSMYCLNAEKSFPGQDSLEYENKGNFKDSSNENVKALGLSDSDYKALIWLVNNMYLRKQNPEYKDEFLAKAFADKIEAEKNNIPPTTVDLIKSKLTDDDIDVVQQWAIWYFTNRNTEKYASFGSISITGLDVATMQEVSGSYLDVTGSAIRQEYATVLYNYLVKAALAGEETSEVTYPSIAVKNTDINSTVDGKYYKVGPFKVNSGNASASSYTIKLTDGENELNTDKYSILIEGEAEFTTKKVNEIFDQNYYIYLPIENNDISKVQLQLNYKKYETKATLWETNDSKYQPLVLITKENTPVEEVVFKSIEEKTADLALKKYIISVNGEEVKRSNNTTSNQPLVDARDLVSGVENAKYYSFQMGDIFDMNTKYPQITDVTKDISNFDDTAAALKNLDILITIDTALAHLAGALGVKTYLLLCHAPDWRWFDNTTKTEWYPSIKIIKQHDRKTWEDVSKQLVQDIKIDVKKLSKKE